MHTIYYIDFNNTNTIMNYYNFLNYKYKNNLKKYYLLEHHIKDNKNILNKILILHFNNLTHSYMKIFIKILIKHTTLTLQLEQDIYKQYFNSQCKFKHKQCISYFISQLSNPTRIKRINNLLNKIIKLKNYKNNLYIWKYNFMLIQYYHFSSHQLNNNINNTIYSYLFDDILINQININTNNSIYLTILQKYVIGAFMYLKFNNIIMKY